MIGGHQLLQQLRSQAGIQKERDSAGRKQAQITQKRPRGIAAQDKGQTVSDDTADPL